jgi:hypothetical protein
MSAGSDNCIVISEAVCGDELRFDRTMQTCADYDLWLRLSHLPIGRVDSVLSRTRLSEKSMTQAPRQVHAVPPRQVRRT